MNTMLPLEDLVVLDFCHNRPGSFTTMYLGDFGAEVIRIDPPAGLLEQLDNLETGGGVSPEQYAAHCVVDRNKRSIIVNMKSADGQAVFQRLARRADILVEGFSPGVMKRMNADYETLHELNPRLIYCSLTGFGHDGPYSAMPAHDWNYTGMGGALSLIGPRDGPPCLPASFLADMAGAGLHGVIGILLAVAARERTGQGQFVDVTYLDSVISLLAAESSSYFLTGKVPRRGETTHTGSAPWANVYQCKDGEYVTVGCAESHFWENLCRALDREDLITRKDPPREELGEVVSALAEAFRTRTRDEWFALFKDQKVCVAPVYYVNETFADPQVRHRQMLVEIDDPALGTVRQAGIPIKLSATPGEIRSLGVPDGTHSEAILLELGYSAEEIRQLHQSRAIGTAASRSAGETSSD
jgi:crotonobetainyl-CoA:carnitine CoA-transferase CaiB-like acyl-CoA transferase